MDQQELKSLLHYDPETGVFRWRVRQKQMRQLDIAGATVSHGYRRIIIKANSYLGHRLAWFYVHGYWPPEEIDHINGDPSDNRIVNLRLASPAQNKRNVRRSKRNKSGFKGVFYEASRGKWLASIRKDGRGYNLGRYSTPEEAHRAYCEAAEKMFGEFARAA